MGLASQSAVTPQSVCRQWTLVRDWLIFILLDLNDFAPFCFPERAVAQKLPCFAGLWLP